MKKPIPLLFMCCLFLFFACKSAPKDNKPAQHTEEEKIERITEVQSNTTEEKQPQQAVEPEPKKVYANPAPDSTIYFAPLSYEIDRFSARKLDDIAHKLAESNVKKIVIRGHSAKLDSTKDEERIALQRALSVARRFQATGLFDPDNIRIESKGAAEPAGRHEEITERSKNRRVEIQSAE